MSIAVKPITTLSDVPQRALRRRDNAWQGWLFALPHLILFVAFLLLPTLFGFFISLHRWQRPTHLLD